MEEEDAIHNAFSSSGLWKQSSFYQDPDTFESALFTPLQLDSKLVASLSRVEC